jgi:hypothetical protein
MSSTVVKRGRGSRNVKLRRWRDAGERARPREPEHASDRKPVDGAAYGSVRTVVIRLACSALVSTRGAAIGSLVPGRKKGFCL